MSTIDLLKLGDIAPGEPLEVRAWSGRHIAAFQLKPGWWRPVADFDSGPLFLDLWLADVGDGVSLVLTPGRGALFRSEGGRVEAHLGLGPEAGRLRIRELRLEPAGYGSLALELFLRALNILASGDLRRLTRAAKVALSPRVPVALRQSADKAAVSLRPLLTSLRAGIEIEGDDASTTLASLNAQVGANWGLSDDAGPPPDFWVRLRAGDRLRPDALAQIADRFSAPEVHAVYADEAHGDDRTTRPCWDEELAQHADYVGRITAWRASTTTRPVPIDQTSIAMVALADRFGPQAVDCLALPLLYRPDRPAFSRRPNAPRLVPSHDRVSVIVPTRDRPELIGPSLRAILDQTDHPDLELIVVDNGTRDPDALRLIEARSNDSRVRILRVDAPFNYSALNNLAAREATGAILALVNNDVIPREDTWLSHLAARAAEPGVGAVGPLLLYPNGTVQHAGVALGVGGVAGHPWKGTPEAEVDQNPHLALPQQRSALTAACLVLRRDVFEAVGGFDEARFPVTLNDVDLCLKIGQTRRRLVFDPRIRLTHYESRSRPSDRSASQRARVLAEQTAFRLLWSHRLPDDPWYSPALTRADETGRPRG